MGPTEIVVPGSAVLRSTARVVITLRFIRQVLLGTFDVVVVNEIFSAAVGHEVRETRTRRDRIETAQAADFRRVFTRLRRNDVVHAGALWIAGYDAVVRRRKSRDLDREPGERIGVLQHIGCLPSV